MLQRHTPKKVEIPANIHPLGILASYLKKKKRSFQRWKKTVEYTADITTENWSKPQVKDLCSQWKLPTSKMHPRMAESSPLPCITWWQYKDQKLVCTILRRLGEDPERWFPQQCLFRFSALEIVLKPSI